MSFFEAFATGIILTLKVSYSENLKNSKFSFEIWNDPDGWEHIKFVHSATGEAFSLNVQDLWDASPEDQLADIKKFTQDCVAAAGW